MTKITVLVTLRTDYQWRKGLNMDVLAWTLGHEDDPEELKKLRDLQTNRSGKWGWNIQMEVDCSVDSATEGLYFTVYGCNCSWGVSKAFKEYADAVEAILGWESDHWVLFAPRVE